MNQATAACPVMDPAPCTLPSLTVRSSYNQRSAVDAEQVASSAPMPKSWQTPSNVMFAFDSTMPHHQRLFVATTSQEGQTTTWCQLANECRGGSLECKNGITGKSSHTSALTSSGLSQAALQLLPADVNQCQQFGRQAVRLHVCCCAHVTHCLFCFNWVSTTIVTAAAGAQGAGHMCSNTLVSNSYGQVRCCCCEGAGSTLQQQQLWGMHQCQALYKEG